MAAYTAYELTFKTVLHLGRYTGPAQTGQLGLEKTDTYIPADTLFSALCQTWAIFYGNNALEAFLDSYTKGKVDLPLRLTSAFPYAGSVRFFPKPLVNLKIEDVSEYKKIKKIQFVSHSIFQAILNGETPALNEDLLINNGKMWVNASEKNELETLLKPSNAEAEETDTDNQKKDDLIVWKTDGRPRVTLDRGSYDSQIWHVETLQFNKNCGLWFAAEFESDNAADTETKIDTLLTVLGDTGVGGERNAGYGLFEFTKKSVEIDTATGSSQFVTLAPLCPKNGDELKTLISGDVLYLLTNCGGWGNSTGTPFQRTQVMMFSEGSVLATIEGHPGRLVPLMSPGDDVRPHSVYRYGYAWPVGIQGDQP